MTIRARLVHGKEDRLGVGVSALYTKLFCTKYILLLVFEHILFPASI